MRPADMLWMCKDGVEYRAPADIHVPTCVACGEVFLDPALEDRIERRVQLEVARHERLAFAGQLERLARRTHAKRDVLAAALGVHPTYLPKIANGTRSAGATLAILLDVFERFPMSFMYVRSKQASKRAVGSMIAASIERSAELAQRAFVVESQLFYETPANDLEPGSDVESGSTSWHRQDREQEDRYDVRAECL